MNDVPRPRILFEEVPDDQLLTELARLAGSYGVFGKDVKVVHASDWDLVVSFHQHPEEPDGVHVLSFGGTSFGEVGFDVATGSIVVKPSRRAVLHARTTASAEGLPSALRSLVERSIVASDPGPGRVGLASMPHGHMPLAVVGAEKSVWAAMFERNGARIWALPAETTAHVDWLVYVLESLHVVDPKRFPGRPDWQKSAQWGSAEMRELIAELDEIETERFRMTADFDARAVAADERLRVATQEAVSGPQRVLTEQGEQLEIAVQQLLDDLGFEVVHMDAYHETNSGGRLEDLRVSPPGGGWTCLVEIKGYASGAKVNDISKVLGRPSTVYAAREGREPDAVWHVVNAWRGKDPATREVAIPQSLDLIDLADARGCLIDTRDLFRAWRDVQSGRAQPEVVRASLMEARTRWTWQGEV